MARKGKFGRSAAGSQNLSALVYSLLKEERQAQEDTMLTAYRTNMTSGTAAGTFTSGGATTAATANAVRQWYLDQATAAASSGDTVGAARFRARAEEFRVQALSDQERVLDRAYEEGSGVDLALFGLSGTNKITAEIYEQIMNGIANDPAMTTSDKQRMQGKIYTVAYDYANEQMVNGFNEGKYTAAQLVSFYDKELKAAVAAGLTETSKTYRQIQSARANAISRNKSEIEAGRQTKVNDAIAVEADNVARSLQKLITPVIDNYTTDANTARLLKAAIGKEGGSAWLKMFKQLSDDNRWDVTELYRSGASSLGLSVDDMNIILRQIADTSRQIEALQAQGYGTELSGWPAFIAGISDAATDGLFSASSNGAVARFSTQYAQVGGNIVFRGSGEPGKTKELLANLAGTIGGVNASTVTESGKQDIITRFAQGDLTGLFDDPTVKTVDDLIARLGSVGPMAGASPVDIAYDFATFLHVLKSNPEDAFSLPVGQAFQMAGGKETLLQETITPVGGFGTFTMSDVLRLHLESTSIPTLVKQTPGYALVFDYDKGQTIAGRNTFSYQVELQANVSKDNYAIAEDSAGNMYYSKIIKMPEGSPNIGFVAVPGGGNTLGDSNDLVIIQTEMTEAEGFGNAQKVTYKLTMEQLREYGLWLRTQRGKGGDFATPSINVDQGVATLVMGTALRDGLLDAQGQTILAWANTKGEGFLNTIRVKNYGGQIVMNDKTVAGYARKIFDAGVDAREARVSVQKWLKDTQGIDDTTFNLTDAILNSGLRSIGDGWAISLKDENGQWQWYQNFTDPNRGDNLPPAPQGSNNQGQPFASTNPSFGIPQGPKPTPSAPMVAPTRPGSPGAAAGMPTRSNFIPTSDLLEHTLRNIGPSLRPGSPSVAPELAPGVKPGSVLPTMGPIEGERGSGPQARGIMVAPEPASGKPARVAQDVRFGRRNV